MQYPNKVPYFIRAWLRIKNMTKATLIRWLPYFKFIRETADYKSPITFELWYDQKIKGNNRYCYWPVHPTSLVVCANNVELGVETFPGYMPGCYIQGIGRIVIGDHSVFAANVGIISSNHSIHNATVHDRGEVRLGRYCWIGMNATILPNVVLGDFTIVGAGAVVTNSFDQGYCVIGGNPARILKRLSKSECVETEVRYKYHGYLTESEFQRYRGDISG